MSFTIQTDPAREGSSSSAELEPTTRIYHGDKQVGVIVHDAEDDVYDIWISIKDPTERIGWRWLHRKERPGTLLQANRIVHESFEKLTTEFQLHYFP